MNSRNRLKPIILTFVSYYVPGYKGGGALRTVENMVNRLSNDFTFWIVTSDRDLGDVYPYDTVKVDDWNIVGPARVFYASQKSRSLIGMLRLMRETPHSVLYLNSFFDLQFTLRPLLAQKILGFHARKPTVVAPRGEFSPGAYQIKIWRKSIFVRLARLTGLFDDVTWQGSTQSEIEDIKHISPSLAINAVSAPDLCGAADFISPSGRADGAVDSTDSDNGRRRLRVCFVSRISPMKNLDYALRVLAKVKCPVYFSIYGPKELIEYWDECQELIDDLPGHISVEYHGAIENSEVRSVISAYDLFFLPTRGENFGHVLVEALSAGVPILVSDQTPWCQLKRQELGWDIPLDKPLEFVLALEEAAEFNGPEREHRRAKCIEFSQKVVDDPEALHANRALFLNAIKVFKSKV